MSLFSSLISRALALIALFAIGTSCSSELSPKYKDPIPTPEVPVATEPVPEVRELISLESCKSRTLQVEVNSEASTRESLLTILNAMGNEKIKSVLTQTTAEEPGDTEIDDQPQASRQTTPPQPVDGEPQATPAPAPAPKLNLTLIFSPTEEESVLSESWLQVQQQLGAYSDVSTIDCAAGAPPNEPEVTPASSSDVPDGAATTNPSAGSSTGATTTNPSAGNGPVTAPTGTPTKPGKSKLDSEI